MPDHSSEITSNSFKITSNLNKTCLFIGTGFLIILIIHLIYLLYFKYFYVESYRSSIDGKDYNIVSAFSDHTHEEAANRLALINNFINKFIQHLHKKYFRFPQPDNKTLTVIMNLTKRYNPNVLRENNPISIKNTSYVLNKGEEIGFCLRKKESKMTIFEDFSDVQFVVLHELAHLAADGFGHDKDFWDIFTFLLKEAHASGLYVPKDYGKPGNEIIYCGVPVSYNPYFGRPRR
jgi:hypothetical protein